MVQKIYELKIKNNNRAGSDLYIMDLETPDGIFSKPGQFISVLIPHKTLRRPISIMENTGSTIRILYKVRGEGTNYLAGLNAGNYVNFAGVFGNFFKIGEKNLLVGAGVGLAPVYYLKKELEKIGRDAKLIAGFKTKTEVPRELSPFIDYMSTDDGSFGEKGSVIDLAEKYIKEFMPDNICICGPVIVMEKISEAAAQERIQCQVSMESMMGCSVGACRGCVIKINDSGVIRNAAVCKEGPVFDALKVFGGKSHA